MIDPLLSLFQEALRSNCPLPAVEALIRDHPMLPEADIAGELQRRAAITTLRVDQRWANDALSIKKEPRMTRIFLTLITLAAAHASYAYEYPLQFTPQSGARGLVIAGYQFNAGTVGGNCSYYTVSSGSGRGARSITTYHYNACTWDFFGNLISLTPASSAPVAPPPLSHNGTEIIYAVSGASSTGQDTRGFGFVNTPSSHYTWQTVNGGYAVIPWAATPITATFISDGDSPLIYSGATATATPSGFYTPSPGTATVSATTCTSSVAPGAACSVTVTYNPKTVKCTASPYGYAYTKVSLSLVTNAGASIDFTQGFTITGVPICDD